MYSSGGSNEPPELVIFFLYNIFFLFDPLNKNLNTLTLNFF